MNQAYITKSSLKKIIFQSNLMVHYSIDNLVESIMEDFKGTAPLDIKKILSVPDIRLLYYSGKILEYINKGLPIDKREISQYDSVYLLNSNSKPKYHLNKECAYITSDFINFLIPPEIKERGQKEIERAQAFAYEHRQLLRHDEAKFIAKLSAQFMLINPPSKVNFENTGIHDFSSLSLDEILDLIKEKISVALSFLSLHNSVLDRKKYIPKYKCSSKELPEVIEWVTVIKPAIIDSIFEYTLKKNNFEGMSFSIGFLKTFDFEECKACSK